MLNGAAVERERERERMRENERERERDGGRRDGSHIALMLIVTKYMYEYM